MTAISIAEAWDIAWPAALEWDNDAQLFELNSTGQYDPLDIEAGSDGRRRGWNAFFGVERAGLLVQIFDGAVVRAMEVSAPSGRGRSALADRPLVDSTEAVPSALAAVPGFTGSLNKTAGLYLVLGTSEDGASIISMTGQYRGQQATIQMDAATGDVIKRSATVPGDFGGALYSRDAGETWHASNLVGMIGGVTGVPEADGRALAVVAGPWQLALYETRDAGATWSRVSELPEEAGVWAYDIAVTRLDGRETVLVGTVSGLWFSDDAGASWQKAGGLPDGPPQWVAVAEGRTASRIYAGITAGAGRGLHSSTDLINWTRELEGTYRLSASYDRQHVLAIPNEGFAKKIAALFGVDRVDEPRRIVVTGGARLAAGAFDGSASLVSLSSRAIRLSEDDAASWRTTSEDSFATIAASPDFSSDGAMVAGGSEAGLFTSGNGGATWQQVLTREEAFEIVAGSGGFSVDFISSTDVVAVSGGDLTWTEF